MQHFALTVYCFSTIAILVVQGDGSPVLPPGTIQIQSKTLQANVRRSETYHSKQQQPRVYTLHGGSETFFKLPGTTLALHHTEPLLYKVRFEGKCYSPHAHLIWLYLHLMVDDHVFFANKFLPNTADRYKYNVGSTENDDSDQIGGFKWYISAPALVTCAFSDIMYLNAGLHVIDVGVRGGHSIYGGAFPLSVMDGVLTVELIQYDRFANIGMQPMNVAPPTTIG